MSDKPVRPPRPGNPVLLTGDWELGDLANQLDHIEKVLLLPKLDLVVHEDLVLAIPSAPDLNTFVIRVVSHDVETGNETDPLNIPLTLLPQSFFEFPIGGNLTQNRIVYHLNLLCL